jgi:two-component system alkaline phosphatase synthesis response regulator PhoP
MMIKASDRKEQTILVADDEPDLIELLSYTLSGEGYTVFAARDGREALRLAKEHQPQLILLDIMMPYMDGIEVCRLLRADGRFQETPIVILTARGEEYSEIAGFDAGADDYVTKPVRMRSLLKRIESLLKRNHRPESGILEAPPFKVDREKYIVFNGETEIRLPRKEFELLHLLVSRLGKVVTREDIIEKVWGTEVVVVDRTIDVHIRRIRKKIGEEYIQTVKGVGYKFVAAV